VGRSLHDDFARARLAGKGDGVHPWVRGDVLTGRLRAEAMHDVVDALGNADLVHHLPEERGRLRRFFGGFDYHRIAAGKCRTDLPGHEQEREIPRTNHPNHAHGAPHRVIERAAAVGRRRFEEFRRHVLDDVGEDLEVGRAARNVDVARQAHRFAGIGTFGREEFVETPIDAVGHGVEQLGALGHRQPAPRSFQCRARCPHRGVDLRLAGLMHHGDHLPVDGGVFLEGLSGGDEGAVDEIADFFHGHPRVERKRNGSNRPNP